MTVMDNRVDEVLRWLERRGTRRIREDMVNRYNIHAPRAYGVSVGTIQQLARRLGRDHDLALALWDTGWYEARLLTAYVDEPGRVTARQMDRWARDFDNWGVVDTLCFSLFDRTAHAWKKVDQWSRRKEEFVKRAAFALLACLAAHDKGASDEAFIRALVLVERAATDDRNFVKKGVSWAIRMVGRRNQALNTAAVGVAQGLLESPNPTARSLGKEALREFSRPAVKRQILARQYRVDAKSARG